MKKKKSLAKIFDTIKSTQQNAIRVGQGDDEIRPWENKDFVRRLNRFNYKSYIDEIYEEKKLFMVPD